MKATVDQEKCIGCGQCVDICPIEAIELDNGFAVISDECIECGACTDACPTEAISLPL
ncbi:MAG: 4Fe-4S binding protein [Desulfosporosinus sp.]